MNLMLYACRQLTGHLNNFFTGIRNHPRNMMALASRCRRRRRRHAETRTCLASCITAQVWHQRSAGRPQGSARRRSTLVLVGGTCSSGSESESGAAAESVPFAGAPSTRPAVHILDASPHDMPGARAVAPSYRSHAPRQVSESGSVAGAGSNSAPLPCAHAVFTAAAATKVARVANRHSTALPPPPAPQSSPP